MSCPSSLDPGMVHRLQQELEASESRNTYIRELLQSQDHISFTSEPAIHQSHLAPSSRSASSRTAHLALNSLVRSQSTNGHGQFPKGTIAKPEYPSYQGNSLEKRARSQQTHPSQSMLRSASHRSESQMPFRQTGNHIAPLANPNSLHRPVSSHQQSPVAHLASVPEVGVNPFEYLAATSHETQDYLDNTRLNWGPPEAFNNNASVCPSLWSGPTAMDIQGPYTNGPLMPDNDASFMIRNMSSQSHFTDASLGQQYCSPTDMNGRGLDQGQRGTPPELSYMGGASHLAMPLPQDAPMNHSLSSQSLGLASSPMERTPSSETRSMQKPSFAEQSVSMQRSGSNSSSRSQRFQERKAEVIRNGAITSIAPRPGQDSTGPDSASALATAASAGDAAQDTASRWSSGGATNRRKPQKVRCTMCKEKPAFRGEHELRRHMDAKHAETVVKWKCVQPAGGITPKKPLKGCKVCEKGKLYNAYYNGTAHLRRFHFNPRSSSGGKRGGRPKVGQDEKRGGMGGGNWPSMDVLKDWLVKVNVQRRCADDDEEHDGAMQYTETVVQNDQLPAQGDAASAHAIDTPAMTIHPATQNFAGLPVSYDPITDASALETSLDSISPSNSDVTLADSYDEQQMPRLAQHFMNQPPGTAATFEQQQSMFFAEHDTDAIHNADWLMSY